MIAMKTTLVNNEKKKVIPLLSIFIPVYPLPPNPDLSHGGVCGQALQEGPHKRNRGGHDPGTLWGHPGNIG